MIDLTKRLRPLCLALFAGLVAAAPAAALAPQDEEASGEEEAEEEPVEPDTGARWLAVVGGDVVTGTGAVLPGATVLAKNGKIHDVGQSVYVPEDAEVLDVSGYRVYPGLVAISSRGLLGGGSDVKDSIDPFNQQMVLGLSTGITTTGGGNAAAKLKRYELEGALLADNLFVTLQWSDRSPSGKSSLVEKFAGARRYLHKYRKWEEDSKRDKDLAEPSRKGVDASVLSVLRGEKRARFSTGDRNELLGIARLAQEYEFQPVIEGVQEGWTIPDELGRAGAYAVVTPRDRRPKDERQVHEGGTSIENAALLHRHGVQVAVVPQREGVELGGIVGRDIMHLPVEAAFAIRGGLSEQAALESITIVPARILGISHRVGTLEVGKDADLIVTDGDLLHYQTFVQWAVVDGKVVYDKEDELFFAHIRPRPESSLAPETKVDPGEEPPAEEEASEEDEEGDDEEGDDGDEPEEDPEEDPDDGR